MWPDRVSNPGPPTYESDAQPIALRGPAIRKRIPSSESRGNERVKEKICIRLDCLNMVRIPKIVSSGFVH